MSRPVWVKPGKPCSFVMCAGLRERCAPMRRRRQWGPISPARSPERSCMRAKRKATWSMAARPCRRAAQAAGGKQPRHCNLCVAYQISLCTLPPSACSAACRRRRCCPGSWRGDVQNGARARRRAGGGLWRTLTLRPWTWATARMRPCLACLTDTAAGASDLTRLRPACAASTPAGCPPTRRPSAPEPAGRLPGPAQLRVEQSAGSASLPARRRARGLTHARRACTQRGGKVLPKVHGEGDDAAAAVP